MSDFNLGTVTAYGYAKDKGYTGTEAEFAELMASYADVAEQAAESATQAAASATTASTKASEAAASATAAASSKTAAETAQSGAETAAQTATTKAGEATTAATTATNKATEATTAATTATGKATEAAGSATTATTKAGEASTSATNAAASATRAQEILDSIPEDYSQLSDDVSDLKDGLTAVESDVTDLKEDMTNLEGIMLKSQSSSMGSGTATAGSKRLLLNVDNPISNGAIIGDLFLVANSGDTTSTIKVELATKNENGSYTVYESTSVSFSETSTAGDILRVLNVNKTTIGSTYLFVTFGTANKFRAASATGKKMVVGDDISSTTFTVRDVNNYEVDYIFYYGLTNNFIQSVTNNLNVLNSAVGDYGVHTFTNASQSSGNWNNYIYKSIPSGTKVRITMLSNTANIPFNIRAYDSSNNNQLIQGIFKDVGGTVEATLTLNAVHIRLQAAISSTITNAKLAVVITTDTQPGLVSDLFDASIPRVYHVEKDGSGDFTNLADALEVATQWMNSVVYVGAGTWNILNELGETRLANLSSSYGGIVLKNKVHVICSSKAYIKCLYSGSDANVINYLSAFNAGKNGFTLENADIEVANVRYCVHDERNAETDQYNNYYLNCRMKNTNQTSGSRSQCIGGGLGYDGHIVIDGCTFENPLRENYGVVSYHNAHGAATDSRSLIEVKGSYFKGKNTFRAGYYGNSTVMTQCLVHGNSMGAEPYVTQEDASFTNVNMEIIAWGNEIRST